MFISVNVELFYVENIYKIVRIKGVEFSPCTKNILQRTADNLDRDAEESKRFVEISRR